MKKNLFMTAAAIAALLTGCSTDEEIANIETSAKNAIGFNIVSNGAETKATIYGSGSKDFDFDVFAFNSTTGDLFMGDHPQDSYAHNGVDIYHNGSEWGYRNSNELAYWPSDKSKLSFYAISPATVAQDMLQHYMWNIHGPKSDKGNKISCSLVDEYGEVKGTNYDLMYATAFNYDKTINNTKVKLSFKHTLSQVIFKGTTSNSSLKADIQSIKIKNIKFSGIFSIPADPQTGSSNYARDPQASDWTLNEPKHSVAAKMAGDNVLVDNTDVKDLSKTDEPILVIPQVLTPWSTNTSIDDNSYLEISMKLTQNGQYVIGTESAYQTIYVPFINVDTNNATGWEPGKCYIYTLNFGGGYDKNGNPILTPITFEPTVEDWEDASGYNIQVK